MQAQGGQSLDSDDSKGFTEYRENEMESSEDDVERIALPESNRLPPIVVGDTSASNGGAAHMGSLGAIRPPLPPIGAQSPKKNGDEGRSLSAIVHREREPAGSQGTSNQQDQTQVVQHTQSSLCSGCFQSPKCLLFCLCLCSTTQGFLINGIVSVSITTLEKRFHLSSTQSGLFSAMYDIAVCLVLIPVCHYGGRGHKGRWIGLGMLIMGIGSVTCALPQFLTRADNLVSNSTDVLCSANASGRASEAECNSSVQEHNSPAYVILLLGQLLHGFGASTIYTIGITYLDENVAQYSSPLYLAIFLGCSLLGTAIGYLLGAVFLKINGNIGVTHVKNIWMSSEDGSWYGAWWLGYLVAAAMCWLVAVPLMCFPKTLAGTTLIRQRDVNQTHASDGAAEMATQIGFGDNWAEFRRSLKTLFKNPTFLLLIAVDCLEAFADTGVVLYMPKIIQNFFSKPPSTSSLITGLAAVPAGLTGNIIGGYISRRFQLKCGGMIILALAANCFCFWLVLLFLAHCDQPVFAGVTTAYSWNNLTTTSTASSATATKWNLSLYEQCNVGCSCSSSSFSPVCERKSQTQYYSPCFAGCLQRDVANKSFSQCSCLQQSLAHRSGFAIDLQDGACDTQGCSKLSLFVALLSLLIAISFLTAIPVQQAQLRCVPFTQRTVAFGIRWLAIRLFGTIPGPILFGRLVDANCLLWDLSCRNQRLSCVWYNIGTLSYVISFSGMFVKGLIIFCLFLAWKVYRPLARVRPATCVEDSKAK